MGLLGNNNVTINAPLFLKGIASITGDLNFASSSTANTVSILNNVGGTPAIISGATDVSAGVMTAADKTTFDAFFGGTYGANISLGGTFNTGGLATLNSLIVTNDATINGNLTLNGNVIAPFLIDEKLTVTGDIINSSGSIFTSAITATDASTFNSDLHVGGTLSTAGIADVQALIFSNTNQILNLDQSYVAYSFSQGLSETSELTARRNINSDPSFGSIYNLSGNITSFPVSIGSNPIIQLGGYSFLNDVPFNPFSTDPPRGLLHGQKYLITGPGTFNYYDNESFELAVGESVEFSGFYNAAEVNAHKTNIHTRYIYSEQLTPKASHDSLSKKVGLLMSTGITSFADMTASATPPLLDVGAVKGQIVDNTSDPDNPVVIDIDYPGATDVAIPNIATPGVSHVYIDNTGTLQFSTTLPSSTLFRQILYLGSVGHLTANTITSVNNLPNFVQSPLNQLQEIINHLQIFIPEGNSISIAGPNQIAKSAGLFVALGGGDSPIENHRVDTLLENPVGNMVYVLSDGNTLAMTGGNTLDSNIRETGTTGVTQAVAVNKWTNQYVIMFRNGRVNVQLGQASYNSSDEAIAAIKTGHTLFPNAKSFGVVLAVLTVQQGDDFTNAIVTNGDYFGIKIG